MFDTAMMFGNGMSISESTLEKTVNAMLATLKKELPEEAQCFEICEYVLDRCKDNLKCRKMNL